MSDQQRIIGNVMEACERHGLESDSLIRYLQHGISPGGFLTAVLEDSLVGAAARADYINQHKLFDWADVMYAAMPMDARGSPKNVAAWIKVGGFIGRNMQAVQS